MKRYWEIIVNKIIKAGFSLGWVSALDVQERTIWIVDAHGDGKRFVVRADEKPTAFAKLESEIWGSSSFTCLCTVTRTAQAERPT
jgi:hypothetical protein